MLATTDTEDSETFVLDVLPEFDYFTLCCSWL